VGTNKCEWVDDLGWFRMNPRYQPFGLESQKGHLAFCTQTWRFPFNHGFVLILMIFLFPRCRWGEWDSCPFHHKDLDTYVASSHALIWSQWAYFYGCHVWHQWWSSSHKGASCLDYYELANMGKFGGVVECHVGKTSLTYARLETIMFHYGWCPTRTSSIAIGCTLIFYFLLHCFMF
jgi:hypothetical protein